MGRERAARLGGSVTLRAAAGLWCCTVCLTALLLVGNTVVPHAAGQTEPPRPFFQETACDLARLSPEIAARARCGTVGVPHSYSQPGQGLFRLAVVVVRSALQPTLPDPVVYVSGGPGSSLTAYADYQARHSYAENRDLIGHNVRHFSPCGAAVVAAFINRPEQAPDVSCAQRPAPIHFLPR